MLVLSVKLASCSHALSIQLSIITVQNFLDCKNNLVQINSVRSV